MAYRAPLVAYIVVVLAASLLPAPERLPDYRYADKFYHFAAYLVMGVLCARAFDNGRPGRPGARVFLAAGAVAFLFGAFVEISQSFFPYRNADALDAVVNGAGGFAGAALWGRLKALA